jgi:peptide/nickel transport system substrate-binding protein
MLIILLTACAPANEPAPEKTEEPAVVVEPTEVVEPPVPEKIEKTLVVTQPIMYTVTFDISIMATAGEPVRMVYDTLVSMDTNYEFQPGALTESYEFSEDGTLTTFHLKEGITFHDGSAFNAEVVKWNIELAQQDSSCCAYLFTPVTEVEVVDEYTVAIHTEGGFFPGLLFNLSSTWGLMMSMEKYEACGEDYGLTPECVSGTGPFILEEWVINDHFTLAQNEDYDWAPAWTGHEGPSNVTTIQFNIVPEDATRLVQFEAGDVHLVFTAPWREVPTYQDDPDYQVIQIPVARLWFIGFNLEDPMVADLRTRQAIGHAIDREIIKDTLYQGYGASKTTYLANEIGGDKGVTGPDFDLVKAKELLAAAGWVEGDDGILVAENVEGVEAGTVFEVDYITYDDDEARRNAEVTQNMLMAVGIKANVQQMDKPTYDAELEAGNFVICMRRYTWDNNDILPWFHHSQYLPYTNYVRVNDPALDTMFDDADYKSSSWEQRDVEYRLAHQYLIDTHYPWAPVHQGVQLIFGRASVVNFTIIPMRGGMSAELWLMIDLEE